MFEYEISQITYQRFKDLYEVDLPKKNFIPTKTKKDFEGDFTLVVFPLLRYAKTSPEKLADELGKFLKDKTSYISDYNVIKGFLNLSISPQKWIEFSNGYNKSTFQIRENTKEKILIEFSSPNTNKPLHLGHIRNNLLGDSISNLLSFIGHDVTKVSLLNDRGIHICKTMVAWEEWGNKISPEQANKKGDHLIGDFYISFEQKYKKEIEELIKSGYSKKKAEEKSQLLNKAKKYLKKWERSNKKVIETWNKLNSWVIEGFKKTYKELGIEFDRTYFESETYLKGKDIILKEMSKGTVKLNDDNSISIDLTDVGLDEKYLLRSDGTSVYITQDIGTAVDRYKEYKFDKHIYIVGNEQDYHFKVLREILKKFGYDWYNKIIHYSYGMVELPDGKMKSREGTVVDADNLIEQMYKTAEEKTRELGKLQSLSSEEIEKTKKMIALGALKYFILKIDARKNILFNPQESIDFNGNTGPFIQYTYARINSLIEKASFEEKDEIKTDINITNKELVLIKEIYRFKNTIKESAEKLNPSIISNYLYELAKAFNSFYQEIPIIKSQTEELKKFRLKLSKNVALNLKTGLKILGINVPKRM